MPEVFNLSPNLISKFKIILLTSSARTILVLVKNNQNKELKFWINAKMTLNKSLFQAVLLTTLLLIGISQIPSYKESKGRQQQSEDGLLNIPCA